MSDGYCWASYATGGIYWPQQSILVTPPTIEPVDLDTLKLSIRIDHDDDDALLAIYLAAARRRFEGWTLRALAEQVREVRLDRFYDAIRLPYPVHFDDAIVSVKYTDGNGAEVTVDPSDYRLTDAESEMGAVLRPVYNGTWPDPRLDAESVRIRYTCGYPIEGSPAAVSAPGEVVAAICAFVGHMYQHRESVADSETYEVPDLCWHMMTGQKVRWF